MVIYPGAKIVGPVLIGHNSTIGANVVVLKTFSPNSEIVGCPGRKKNKDIEKKTKELMFSFFKEIFISV